MALSMVGLAPLRNQPYPIELSQKSHNYPRFVGTTDFRLVQEVQIAPKKMNLACQIPMFSRYARILWIPTIASILQEVF
jgi:hypothetical protein